MVIQHHHQHSPDTPFSPSLEQFDPDRYQQFPWKGVSRDKRTGKQEEYLLTVDTHEWRVVGCTCRDYYYRVLPHFKDSCKHQDTFNKDEPDMRRERLQMFLRLEERKREERQYQIEPGRCNCCHCKSIAAVCDDCLYRR